MIRYAPHVIAVGASCPEANQLLSAVQNLAEHFLINNVMFLKDMLSETQRIYPKLLDESLAELWESCRLAEEEFREFPLDKTRVRRAVALGRCLLDQLAVLSALAYPQITTHSAILALNLHPQ